MQNFVDDKDLNLSNNVKELQEQVRELSKKNEILAADNVDMSEKKFRLYKQNFRDEKKYRK